ncbi:MAG: hypothetical protein IJ409_00210 [Lachnospiraceae bacterium]|nr:hypothetical protein [Lachnospiraceae bacterium]
MTWWKDKPFRMIQNNLRDIDAAMDIDKYVDTLKEFHANVCMVGCGGITSFYPTELPYQQPSPYMKGDFIGRLVEKCHENNIRVIARFDFSKTNIKFKEQLADCYSLSVHGEPVLYNDTIATCVNGRYQQELSMKILEEVITRYPVDGVFFNMFGYQTWDYSGNYVGICQCESCKRRFKEFSGYDLPTVEDEQDEVFRKYQQFRSFTTNELVEKIYAFVKKLNPEIAVCTYSSKGVDLVRNESNSAVDRPLPFWTMASENNVDIIRGTFEDRFSSNCCINAVDIFYRFQGVSTQLNALRLYGAMASGGNLDWCIIGGFETYPDKKNFESVKEIFGFHEANEQMFAGLTSCAKVLLVNPQGEKSDSGKEYLGIYKMLKEEHILFDVIDLREREILEQRAGSYQTIILPAVSALEESTLKALENSGAVIIGTAAALINGGEEEIFGCKVLSKIEKIRSSYMLTQPKEIFVSFKDRDWVYLDKEAYLIETVAENQNYLPFVSPSMYGPPERCFGHQVTENACVSVKAGKSIYYPWRVGSLYYEQGYEDFKQIFMDVFRAHAANAQEITVEAPPCVEVFYHQYGEGQYLLQFLNYSGFNGMTFYDPLPIGRIKVKIKGWGKEEKELEVSLDGLYKAIPLTCEV